MTAERETSNSGYPRLGKPASLLLVILFVALLWLPLLGIPFGWQIRTEVVERRTLVDPPAWGEVPAQQAIKQFMNYFNDRFAFRDAMIYAYCLAQVKLFHVSPSDTVVLGKEGWLYFTGGELIKDHQGLTPPSEQELKQWADVLEGRRAWLAERGIHYMFVLVPNKVTIYPEYLPPGIIRKRDTTRADIVTAYLKEHTRVPFLDLRPVLAEAKRERLVYFPFGTHWNHHGTYKGYAQVARQLNAWYPSKPPIPLEDF